MKFLVLHPNFSIYPTLTLTYVFGGIRVLLTKLPCVLFRSYKYHPFSMSRFFVSLSVSSLSFSSDSLLTSGRYWNTAWYREIVGWAIGMWLSGSFPISQYALFCRSLTFSAIVPRFSTSKLYTCSGRNFFMRLYPDANNMCWVTFGVVKLKLTWFLWPFRFNVWTFRFFHW